MSARDKSFNAATFVVVGDGLAAGAGDFGLCEELQPFSFPALAARQIGTSFSQPIVEAPGIGPVIGFSDLPVRLPQPLQTTVLKEFPPAGLFSNVSIPGLKLIDALTRRPVSPLIHRSDGLQTTINLILGMPGLLLPGSQTMPTPVEYAVFRQPTLVLIALGVFDVVDAAFKGDASWIPDDVSFRLNYGHLLSPFGRVPATIVASTLPDPADLAVFTRVSDAPRIVKADAGVLGSLCGVEEGDFLTPSGLVEAGCRVITRTSGPLPEGSCVPAAVVARLSERVASLNAQIAAVAKEHNALVLDLHALFARLKRQGLTVGDRRLTADFFGGIFSLNGVYPGATGHGAIANEFLRLLNSTCGTRYNPVDLVELAANDPVTEYRLAPGRSLTMGDVAALPKGAIRQQPAAAEPRSAPEVRSRITLPVNLEAIFELNEESSYFGDALRAAHTTFERDIPFGSSPNTFFGGLCLTQSHLRGKVHVKFSRPIADLAHFDLSLGDGLSGQDGVLAAPQFFKLPSLDNRVTDIENFQSHGDVNLTTGEVTNLMVKVAFANSALTALVSVNPKIPPTPIEFSNETRQEQDNPHYGSAWAKFEQRADGTLDFMFSGVSFMPLGAGFGGDTLRFPLPFSGPEMKFASIPAISTALHPHLCLSTKPPEATPLGGVPDIPLNTVREYATFTHNSAFGDKFSMNIPEMEGGATGRSHLLGRLLVQFGERSGNSVPFSVCTLMPGGMFAKPPESDMAKEFPGRMTIGLLGHDETLRFKKLAYDMHGVCWIDDPFEVSLGSVDLRTGRVLGPFLFRGFIIQDLLLTLLKLEPRTPKSSWYMRGPAAFTKDPSGQTVFGFNGTTRVVYPEGYGFPKPDLKSVFHAGPNSALDPYFYMQGVDGIAPPPAGKSGAAHSVLASNGQRFSYKYHIPGYPSGRPAAFEYTNEALGGTFRMGSLVWVSFSNANRAAKAGECDCVTFTGIGLWSKDMKGPHMCTVQISTAAEAPYVSILLDGGMLSNVNTKPPVAVMPIELVETV
jgi:hypothetical protein